MSYVSRDIDTLHHLDVTTELTPTSYVHWSFWLRLVLLRVFLSWPLLLWLLVLVHKL